MGEAKLQYISKCTNDNDTNIVIINGVKMTVAEYRHRNGEIKERRIIHKGDKGGDGKA